MCVLCDQPFDNILALQRVIECVKVLLSDSCSLKLALKWNQLCEVQKNNHHMSPGSSKLQLGGFFFFSKTESLHYNLGP